MKSTPRFVATLLLTSAWSLAQVAPATSSRGSDVSPDKMPEQTSKGALVLSPFEVSASNDVGYIATNSLAGSRLNAALKDTPAIIDVFTKEFLADLGANDLQTAMAYSNNSQEDVGDSIRTINGIEAVQASAAFQFRTRGLPGSRARNYFDTRLPIDLYVVDRLDESRGPNSVLFGIGASGGIVNSTTKRAGLTHPTIESTLRAGSFRHFYSALDVDQPIIREKLGLRLNVTHSEQGSWRDYVATRKQGIHGAVTFRPFKHTEIRAEYETGDLRGTLTRNFPARDGVTRWWDAGSPTNPSVGAAALTPAETAAGLSRLTTASRVIYVANQGGYAIDARNSLFTLGRSNGSVLLDTGRMPHTANASGPGARTFSDYDVRSVLVEQRLSTKLFAEVAYHHENGAWLNYDIGSGENLLLNGDPNAYLRNPTAIQSLGSFRPTTDASGNVVNPNAGSTYAEAAWRRRSSSYDADAVRASLAYELDLGRLGSHRFAGMLQRQRTRSTARAEREVWVGAPFAADPANDANAVWRRNYVTLGQSNTFFAPDPLSPAVLTIPYPGRATPLVSDWIPQASFNETDQVVDSGLLALQSYWLKRRIVTTLGYRIDELTQDRISATPDRSGVWGNSTGLFVIDPRTKTRFEFSGRTKTAGVVGHATKWLSVFVNVAENLGLPATTPVGPDGDVPPPPHAKGLDGGVTIEAFNGKIVTRLTYYKTTAENQVSAMGVNNAFTPRYNTVIGILDDPNGDRSTADRIYTPAQMAKYSELRPNATALADSLDNISSGYEARVTANLAAGLRFILNYSYTNQDKLNSYPRTRLLWDQVYAFVADLQKSNPNLDINALSGSGGTSLGSLLATNVTDLADRVFDFEQSLGVRKHKANVFGNYTFQRSKLNGATVGGGVRYQSAINAGADNQDVLHEGSDLFLVDAMARYPLRFALFERKIHGSLQLNVRNLLNDQTPLVLRYAGDGTTISRVNFQTPREFIFSFTAKF